MFTSLLTVKYKATIETFLYKNNTRLFHLMWKILIYFKRKPVKDYIIMKPRRGSAVSNIR